MNFRKGSDLAFILVIPNLFFLFSRISFCSSFNLRHMVIRDLFRPEIP